MNDTIIGQMQDGEYHLRGTPISSLIRETGLVPVVWLAWTGKLPTETEQTVLNACIVASIDHGIEPPSAQVARLVASCGKPLADAVAAGLLTMGPRHGNACTAAARWLITGHTDGKGADATIEAALARGERIPGFGHPVYTTDPRTSVLADILHAQLSSHPYWNFAMETSSVLSKRLGRPMPLNVDGAIGACLADLAAPPELADAVFILGRTAGLVAHALAQHASSPRYLRKRS